MTRRSRCRTLQTSPLLVLGLAAAVVLFVGCQDSGMVHSPADESKEPSDASTSLTNGAHGPPPAAGATVLRATLEPLGSSGVTGQVTVRQKRDRLHVSVNARGLEASVEHAQHFHQNESCESFGPPIISLDANIPNNPGDATNADPGDDRFPVATPGGTVNYQERTSRSALASALGEDPDLANRTVIVHAAGTPIGPPAACGALAPVGR